MSFIGDTKKKAIKNVKIIYIFTLVSFLIPLSIPRNTLQPKIRNHTKNTNSCSQILCLILKVSAISSDITGTPRPSDVVIDATIPSDTMESMIFPIQDVSIFLPNRGTNVLEIFTLLLFLL